MNAIVKITLSEAGRKADILSGGSGAREQQIAVTPEQPEFREVVAAGKIDSDALTLDQTAGYPLNCAEWDHLPTVREVLGRMATAAKEREAAAAAKLAEIATATREVLATRKTTTKHCYDNPSYDYAMADWPYNAPDDILNSPEAVAWQAGLDAAREVSRLAAVQAQAEKDAAVKAENDAKEARRLALRAALALNEEDGDESFCVEDGCLARVPVWESHSRGKNWLAVITTDPTKPGGLDRDFAAKAKGDLYYILPALTPGQAIEFGGDYYSGRGSKSAKRWYGYFVRMAEHDGKRYAILHECETGKEAVKAGQKFAATQKQPAN